MLIFSCYIYDSVYHRKDFFWVEQMKQDGLAGHGSWHLQFQDSRSCKPEIQSDAKSTLKIQKR